jgi:DNA-binding winged helix-turn-helix (wHTH) protein/Flp pilus assembly protein TadD
MSRPEDFLWEFGSFRLHTSQRLLFRDGELVPLSRKAIDILLILVESHGQLIEKDDLMRRVWPDSFVEESNLAVHISQLRKTLGEGGCDYRIETIPRRGYRFIGAVEREAASQERSALEINAPASNLEPESGLLVPATQTIEDPIEMSADLAGQRENPSRGNRVAGWVAAVITTGLVGALLVFALRFRNSRMGAPAQGPDRVAGANEEGDRIVLGEIANKTGEPVFDSTLHEAVVIELEQSPYLSLISEERMRQSLRLMGKPAATALTPELSREICQRNGGVAVLDGSIAKLGTEYVLGVRAVNCRTGDRLCDLQTTVASKELVLKALGDITGQLRTKLGESLSTMQKFDTPIEEATTSSLEALQAYSIGRETMVQKGESAACVPFFQQAVRLDPSFAVAYAALGNAYSNLGETGLAAANIRKAYELSAHVSEHERLYIESHYYQFVTGDLIKASRIYELWAATFPSDEAPRTNLGLIYSDLGRFDRSLELAKEAVRVGSHDGQSYANLVNAYVSLNRPDEANAVAAQAMAENLDSSALRLYLYDAASLQQNSAGMQKQITWASGEPGVEDDFLNNEANNLASSGQLARAKELTDRAADAARRVDEKETAAGYELDEAQREAEFGNDTEARRSAGTALSLARDRDTKYGAAVALALCGVTDRAQSLANEIDKEFPDDTVVQYLYLPTIRGAMALKQKDPGRSLQVLKAARPYEMGLAAGLLPVYIRGLAYLEAKDGEKAVLEFQRIIDHPGAVINAPIGPLARLQMGRAYLIQGKPAQAKLAYEDFLNQWKNADQDIPILRDAMAEYAKQWTPLFAQH